MDICDTCGQALPEPVMADPVIIAADPGPNDNDVRIAEIEAAASIEREQIWTEQESLRLDSEVQELRGELRGIRETLDRLAPPEPEAQPVPVPVPVAEPAPAEPAAAPPETEPKAERKASAKKGFFS
jgi:hypothetical protein